MKDFLGRVHADIVLPTRSIDATVTEMTRRKASEHTMAVFAGNKQHLVWDLSTQLRQQVLYASICVFTYSERDPWNLHVFFYLFRGRDASVWILNGASLFQPILKTGTELLTRNDILLCRAFPSPLHWRTFTWSILSPSWTAWLGERNLVPICYLSLVTWLALQPTWWSHLP